MKTGITLLIIISLILPLLGATSLVHAQSSNLTPSVNEFKILKGTDGTKLGYITYSGTASVSTQWDRCELTVSPAPAQSGLYVKVINKACTRDANGGIKVSIRVAIKGIYTGGDFNWNPFSVIRANLYYNGSLVETVSFTASPIAIKEVKITKIDFGNPPLDTSSISYTALPDTRVNAGTIVFITTSATINLAIELSDYLTIPTTVEVQYVTATQTGGTTTSQRRTVYVTFDNSLTQDFSIPNVPLSMRLPIDVVNNNITIYSTVLDVPSKASQINVGGAIIATAEPLEYWENQQSFKVVSQLYINQLRGGSVTISMTVNGKPAQPRTYTSPGPVDDLYVSFSSEQDTLTGEYEIIYNGPYGAAPKVVVEFSTSYRASTGGLLRNIFYILFMMITSAGFTGVVVGLFLRRIELQTSGMIMLASGVFIFLIPTLMGYAVALLIHTGVEDPVGVSNLNMFNLGDIVDKSIQYIQSKAYAYSAMLFNVAIFSAGIIGVLATLVAGGGIVGWLTAGALSEFLGQVFGALGAQILTLATMSFMASIFLKILGIIFPIILNVIFTILLFTALIQALFAGFTGTYGQVYGTVMSLSVLILTVLLTPCVLATLDYQIGHQKIVISLPWPLPHIEIPDIFTALGLVIIELVLLVMILAMAFQRLMAVLSGMGGG